MGYYQDLYEKSKKTGVSQTKDGGTVTTKPKNSGANDVSSASANLGAGKATGGVSKPITVPKGSGNKSGSNAASIYASLLANQPKTVPTVTYKAPTVKVAVPAKIAQAAETNIAAEAYKKKLAAAQNKSVGKADDEDIEIVKSSEVVDPRKFNGYGQYMLPSDQKTKYGSGQSSTGTFGLALNPEYKTYAEQKAEAAANAAKPYSNYNQYMLPEGYSLFNKNVDGSEIASYNANPNMTLTGETLLDSNAFNAKVDAQKKQIADQKAAQAEAERIALAQAEAEQQRLLEEQQLLEERRMWEELMAEQESAYQAMMDAYNAQAAANIQALQNQSGVLNQQYDNNAANLYAQYRRSGLAMPELLAGTATGIADSLTLQNDLNFQNNLTANELERAAAQNELAAQANQIQADADLQAAQTAADWAQMAYQQRLAAQNSGTKSTTTTKSDDADGYKKVTVKDVKDYLQLQLGMGNTMTKANIESVLKDMYAAGAISKELAKGVASEFGFTLYF